MLNINWCTTIERCKKIVFIETNIQKDGLEIKNLKDGNVVQIKFILSSIQFYIHWILTEINTMIMILMMEDRITMHLDLGKHKILVDLINSVKILVDLVVYVNFDLLNLLELLIHGTIIIKNNNLNKNKMKKINRRKITNNDF